MFDDLKHGKAIKLDEVGNRNEICKTLNKIPSACKPHGYKIVFDEPCIHIFNAVFNVFFQQTADALMLESSLLLFKCIMNPLARKEQLKFYKTILIAH